MSIGRVPALPRYLTFQYQPELHLQAFQDQRVLYLTALTVYLPQQEDSVHFFFQQELEIFYSLLFSFQIQLDFY